MDVRHIIKIGHGKVFWDLKQSVTNETISPAYYVPLFRTVRKLQYSVSGTANFSIRGKYRDSDNWSDWLPLNQGMPDQNWNWIQIRILRLSDSLFVYWVSLEIETLLSRVLDGKSPKTIGPQSSNSETFISEKKGNVQIGYVLDMESYAALSSSIDFLASPRNLWLEITEKHENGLENSWVGQIADCSVSLENSEASAVFSGIYWTHLLDNVADSIFQSNGVWEINVPYKTIIERTLVSCGQNPENSVYPDFSFQVSSPTWALESEWPYEILWAKRIDQTRYLLVIRDDPNGVAFVEYTLQKNQQVPVWSNRSVWRAPSGYTIENVGTVIDTANTQGYHAIVTVPLKSQGRWFFVAFVLDVTDYAYSRTLTAVTSYSEPYKWREPNSELMIDSEWQPYGFNRDNYLPFCWAQNVAGSLQWCWGYLRAEPWYEPDSSDPYGRGWYQVRIYLTWAFRSIGNRTVTNWFTNDENYISSAYTHPEYQLYDRWYCRMVPSPDSKTPNSESPIMHYWARGDISSSYDRYGFGNKKFHRNYLLNRSLVTYSSKRMGWAYYEKGVVLYFSGVNEAGNLVFNRIIRIDTSGTNWKDETSFLNDSYYGHEIFRWYIVSPDPKFQVVYGPSASAYGAPVVKMRHRVTGQEKIFVMTFDIPDAYKSLEYYCFYVQLPEETQSFFSGEPWPTMWWKWTGLSEIEIGQIAIGSGQSNKKFFRYGYGVDYTKIPNMSIFGGKKLSEVLRALALENRMLVLWTPKGIRMTSYQGGSGDYDKLYDYSNLFKIGYAENDLPTVIEIEYNNGQSKKTVADSAQVLKRGYKKATVSIPQITTAQKAEEIGFWLIDFLSKRDVKLVVSSVTDPSIGIGSKVMVSDELGDYFQGLVSAFSDSFPKKELTIYASSLEVEEEDGLIWGVSNYGG